MKSPAHKLLALTLILICLILLPLGQANLVVCIEETGEITLEQRGDLCCEENNFRPEAKTPLNEQKLAQAPCEKCVDIELSLGVADSAPQLTLLGLDTEFGKAIIHPPLHIQTLLGFSDTATSNRLANPPPGIQRQLAVLKTVRLLI